MHGVQRLHIVQTPTDAGLIGGNGNVPSGLRQTCHGFQATRYRYPFVGRFDVVIPVFIDDAITIQNNELMHGSSSEFRQVSHAVHQTVQFAQQRNTVGAQPGVFGHDHDFIEEGIDTRAQGRQCL